MAKPANGSTRGTVTAPRTSGPAEPPPPSSSSLHPYGQARPETGIDNVGSRHHRRPRVADSPGSGAPTPASDCRPDQHEPVHRLRCPGLLVSITLVVVDVYAAIIAALVWTCAAICWRWATRRRPSGLLLLTVATLVVRTAVTLATGNTFIYFLQPVFANAGVAMVFIASLATATPIVARLAADFYPMDAGVSDRPRVRRLFWRLTLLWGLVCLAKGFVTLWLLLSQSRAEFVLAKNVAITAMTALAVAATIWLSAGVARAECLLAHA